MTMRNVSHHFKAGFTLIELVIVLGITGLIFSGLWGLLTSGSSQLQAQAAAQQYRQVIDATRKYITSEVAPYVSTQPAGIVAPAPTVADLKAANLLSTSFSNLDAYGNNILIAVDTIDASKQQWRFTVYSDRTIALSDKIGAQVSSLIGSEGGFVYNNATDGCAGTVNATACGSFNSFALPVADFGVGVGSGRIMNLAYTVDTNSGTAPWLYRKAGITPEQNTMQQNMLFNTGLSLNMQSSAIVMGNGSLSMGATAGATTGATGILYMGNSDIANMRNLTGQNSSMTFSSLTVTTTPAGNDITISAQQNLTLQSASGTIIQSPSGLGISPQDTIVLTVYGGARFYNLESLKFIYSSDERLKKNITPLEDSLSKIMKLNGHAFEWKTNNEKTIGLIAQEVQKVYPELINKDTSGMLGVDYGKLIAPVIEAIKELKKENDALKLQVQELKASIRK